MLESSASSFNLSVGLSDIKKGRLDDCKKLWRDHRVSVRNCVDLALMARSVDSHWKGPYKGGIGLSRLAETYLGRKLGKGRVRTSNWEAALSTQQQDCKVMFVCFHVLWLNKLYPDAANDCHSSVAIYRTLIQRALILERVEEEWFTFDAIKGVLRDVEGRPWFPFNPYYDPGPPPGTAQSDVIALTSE